MSLAEVLPDFFGAPETVLSSLPNSSCSEIPNDLLLPESFLVMDSPYSSRADDLLHPENTPMFDRTRFGMCLFMISFCIFDPFNLLFGWHSGM